MMHLLLAAGDNPVSVQLMPLVTAIVVFGVAFWVLKSQVWPKITKGLDERETKILDEIAAAEEAREQAKAALSEYEESLATARKEASEMIAKAKSDAKAAGEELRRRNETELAELKQRAGREIEAAKHAAISELHAEASSLAAEIAGKILRREISADDQQYLVDESLQQLDQLQQN
jgi:F-type H+-transporting ATPase subunit b